MSKTKLTEHFTLEEFTRTSIKGDNSPSEEHLVNLRCTAKAMEVVRSLFNKAIIVNSAYRSPLVNAAVGGSVSSAHCEGWAVDFNVKDMSAKEVCQAIVDSGVIQFDQIIWEHRNNSVWIHLSFKPTYRRQVLTMRDGKYLKGLVDAPAKKVTVRL